jgi:hypothetical protein
MNVKNFSVVTEDATKITVTITRRQLWTNYIKSWGDIAWDDISSYRFDCLKEVMDVLLSGEDIDIQKLRKLFRDGQTVLLMNDAMEHIDVPNRHNVLSEIVVIDDDKKYVVRHSDINF